MSEPFLAPILNILIKKIKKASLFADSGAGDEQAGDHRGPVPHLCPGNDDNDDDADNDDHDDNDRRLGTRWTPPWPR